MNPDEDVEKQAGLVSIGECPYIDGDNILRSRSRSPGRSRSLSRRSSPEKIIAVRDSLTNHPDTWSARRSSRSPSRHRRSSDNDQRHAASAMDGIIGHGSRPSSPEAAGQRPARNGGAQSNAPRALDPDNPGEFAIQHHLRGLVVQLDEYKPGPVRCILDSVKEKLPDNWRKRPPAPDPAFAGDGKRFRISFAEVQRMRIRKLQCQLVRHVVRMRRDGHESPGWEETLKEYITALKDHDYMETRSKSKRDPFLASGEYAFDNYVLNRNIEADLASDPGITHLASLKPWEYLGAGNSSSHHEAICGTRTANTKRSWYLGFKDRVVLAAVGGAFLVLPMWLMVIQSTLGTLATTTVCVALFGVMMAFFLHEAKDVLASTAAYAAVLVVFVGTSLQSLGSTDS